LCKAYKSNELKTYVLPTKHRLILRKIIVTLVIILIAYSSLPVQAAAPLVKDEDEIVTPLKSVEQIVREYFAETPILAEVARCESRFRQFNSRGTVLRGEVNSSDVGLMQINLYYHKKEALKQGFNLFTVDGNLAYGKYLYEKEGLAPWSASAPCWKKTAKLLQAQAKPKIDVKTTLAANVK
jgi:hypothetical protein